MAEASCPRCGAQDRQERLTEAQFNRLEARLQSKVAAHFDAAYRCGSCATIYSFRDGDSTALGNTSYSRLE